MDIPISRTKIALPTRRTDWVNRPRLLELFYELLEFKLILVTAPAGYGKTTFMADVAHQIEIPICWVSLDELDQDPARFIAHFFASIEARYPGFGKQAIGEFQNQSAMNVDRLTTILANEVYDHIRDHFLIVLDDYYLVEPNPEIRQFISLFIQRTDENCHVALLTRKLPDLPDLTLLVGRTQVGGLSFRELAFTPGEIKIFIRQNYHEEINEETIHALSEQTEGWITGLMLSAQSRWSVVTNQVRVARASGIDLSAYLMAQVLSQQPDFLCRFLLQTSLLEEFNVQFCQQVLGEAPEEHSWPKLIGTVLEKNLFIQPLENGWLRYHHLFRDFLQSQIAQNYPDEYQHILQNLAEIYAGEGEWEKSRAIYVRLDDQTAIANLIERASKPLAEVSRYQTLASWIDALPYALRTNQPAIVSLRGIAAVMLGDIDTGLELLNRAENLFREANNDQEVAQTFSRLGFAYLLKSQYQTAIEHAKKGLDLLDEMSTSTRGEALRVIGLSYWRMGNIHSAAEYLEKARMLYLSLGDESREAMIWIELGIMYRAFGRYNQAEEAYLAVLVYWRSHKGVARAAYTANNLGVLYHFRGKYREAAASLEEALSCADQAGDARAKALAYCSLGDLYGDLEIPEAARAAYLAARPIAQRIQDTFILLYLALAEARLASHQGETRYALQLLDSAREAVAQRSSAYENGLLALTRGQLLLADQPVEALEAFETAYNFFKEGQQTSETILTHFYLAVTQQKLRRFSDSIRHLNEALIQADALGMPQTLVVAAAKHKELLLSFQGNTQLRHSLQNLVDQVANFEEHLPSLRRDLRKRNLPIPVGPPKLVIQGLEANRVSVNGKEISSSDWQTARARDIFFFILENPEGVSREKIAVNFWPEASPYQLKYTFKKTMYRLRRVFEKEPILFIGERYVFDRQGDYTFDVEEFERALKQMAHVSNRTEKKAAMKTAVALYHGLYLPEIDGVWAVEKREYLARRYLETTLALGELALEEGDYPAVIGYYQNLLSLDSCNEEAHRLAMRTHARRGNRSEVVRQFELCKQALAQEYGLTPSPETVDLFKKLAH